MATTLTTGLAQSPVLTPAGLITWSWQGYLAALAEEAGVPALTTGLAKTPMVDPSTGLMTRPWVLYVTALQAAGVLSAGLPRTALVDPRTGRMTREWLAYFGAV